jgi:proteasome activator subunit 4
VFSENIKVRLSSVPVKLALTETSIQWQPKPSYPETEAFVRECQIVPADYDIMGMRGTYHRTRVLQLVDRFKVWREERAPGVRAFHSTYDRYVRDIFVRGVN